MDRTQAREAAKERIEEYLFSKGINPRKPFICLNPQHNDRSPSMSLDRKRYRVHCFSCSASYDIFDLVALDYGLTDPRDIFNKTYEVLRIKPETEEGPKEMKQDKAGQYTHTHVYTHNEEMDFTKEAEAAHAALLSNPQAMAHFKSRGLTEDFIRAEGLGYAEGGYNSLLQAHPENQSASPKAQLYKYVLPFRDDSGAIRYFQTEITDRSQIDEYNGKYRKIKGLTTPLYGEWILKRKAPGAVFLVEGLYDAYSIKQAGGEAIALQGAGGDMRFIKLYRQYEPEAVFIFYMDADGAGDAFKKRILEGLPELEGRILDKRPSAGKDANEELIKDPEAFYQAVALMLEEAQGLEHEAEREAREAYLGTSAGAHLQEFINNIAMSADIEPISTGFSLLDRLLDGGLYEGLISLGAITSLGKTAFVMQIADQIAAAGTDVLIFSLEMARSELMSRSVSRHTAQIAEAEDISISNAKTARGITAGHRYKNYSETEIKLIREAMGAYREYADRVYIQEGMGDIGAEQIRETVEKHILYTGGKWGTDEKTGERRLSGGRRPVVVCDYLQLLAPYNERATDKQNTDKAVLELKRISRDYKIPLIAISSFNRDNYKTPVTLESFKESGAIEYTSDILIGLQLQGAGEKGLDYEKEKRADKRNVELVILKNRGAKAGHKLLFSYYTKFNLFCQERIISTD